jgi:hypothetical protein
MSSRIALLAAVAALAAAAPPAAAKEISKVQVCGASACRTLRGDGLEHVVGGGFAYPPRHHHGWFRMRVTIDGGPGEDMKPFHFRQAYVPAVDRLRARGEGGAYDWLQLDPLATVRLARAVRGLEPLPPATLRGLHPRPVRARTDEPATTKTARAPSPGSDISWVPIAAALAAAAVALALLVRRRHLATATG